MYLHINDHDCHDYFLFYGDFFYSEDEACFFPSDYDFYCFYYF